MNCINCGAALPPKSAVCKYCRTLNDVDLRGVFERARRAPDESRDCPRCDQHLENINVGTDKAFLLERCTRCLGLFFDPGELAAVVNAKAEAGERIDFTRLHAIVNEETPEDFSAVRYVKCPTCRHLMHRRSHGVRSGVIVDECRDHGVWLDGGELRRILAWTRAGGPALQKKRAAEREKEEEQTRKVNRMYDAMDERDLNSRPIGEGDAVATLIGALFQMWIR